MLNTFKYHFVILSCFSPTPFIPPILVKNRKMSETLLYVADIIWPKFSLMNANIRHKIPASKTKNFITHGNSNNQCQHLHEFSEPQFLWVTPRGADDTCTCSEVYTEGDTKHRGPESFLNQPMIMLMKKLF